MLVAFTIATVLLVALWRSFSEGITRSARDEAYNEALILAESTLDELGTLTPLKGDESGERHEGRFTVATEIRRDSEVAQTGQYVGPYELTVEVSWREGVRRQSIRLYTLRLGSWQ